MNAAAKVPTVKLNNGLHMPVIGMGTYFGPLDKFTDEQVIGAIETAIDCGYRHFDAAWQYNTEKAIGRAIANKIQQGVVARQDLFITSKLSFQHHNLADIRGGLKETMADLGVDYLDLYLIHSPFAMHKLASRSVQPQEPFPLNHNNDYVEVWKVLEQCVRDGLVRSIGVSNFNTKQLRRILDNCSIKPVINQFEVHLYLQCENWVEYCISRDVLVTAFAPLGQPLKPPENWISPLENSTVAEVARKYNKSPAQIALKFLNQRRIIVIPKSDKPKELLENVQIFDFTITEEDMSLLRTLNKNMRTFHFSGYAEHKDYPFHDEN